MAKLVGFYILSSYLFGIVMCMNKGNKMKDLFFKYTFLWFFFVLGVAFGVKLGLYNF